MYVVCVLVAVSFWRRSSRWFFVSRLAFFCWFICREHCICTHTHTYTYTYTHTHTHTRGTRWLFWTDWGESPKVEKISMDGTAHTTIISSNIVWPSGLAIDHHTHTLYWSDANLDKLESSDFDGRNRRILLERQFIFYPFGLAFFNRTLYWGDWVVGFVYRLSVVNTTDYNYVRAVIESEPTGLKVVSGINQPQGREREREKEFVCERERVCVHVCVCVCERERGGEELMALHIGPLP